MTQEQADNAKAEADAKAKAAEEAKKTAGEKASAEEDAKTAADAAKQAESDAKNASEKAEAEKTSAKDALDAASSAKDSAQKIVDGYENGEQEKVINDARQAVKDAENAKNAADAEAKTQNDVLAEKEKAVSDAEKKVNDNQTFVSGLESGKKNAESALDDAKKTAESKDAEKSSADKAYEDAQKKTAEAQSDVSEKQRAYDDALAGDAEKKKKADDLQKQADAKQAEIDKVQKQIDNAQDQYSKGFIGFAEWAGDEAAIHSYNTPATVYETTADGKSAGTGVREPIRKYTHDGQDGDASSIENLKNGITIMKEINRLRRGEGKNDMKVSLPAVAAAILHTNWSAYHQDHAGYHGYNGPSANENLAWGYGTEPTWGWYYEEKMVAAALGDVKLTDDDYEYIISQATDEIKTKEDVNKWAEEIKEENSQTGHYYNMLIGIKTP